MRSRSVTPSSIPSSVTINELFPEDAGRYACKATNTKGSVETSSRVNVIPMPKGAKTNGAASSAATNGSNGAGLSSSAAGKSVAPRIFKHTGSSVVKDGDPVRLECTVAGGDSRFDVVWLHNEKEIKPSKDFAYKTVGSNTHVLEIQEIFPEDSGTYTCEAFNDTGECFSSCTLVVEVPGEDPVLPGFKTFPKSLSVEKNRSASFAADLTHAPKEVTLTSKGNKVCLDIMECSTADAGQYAVIVAGDKGENKAAFSLNVH